MDRVDAIVIGAGVVGLAVARRLAMAGNEVLVLERERQFGTGTSSRNSEVIHAGIYYASGSLKERLCIEGRRMLYDYCQSHHVGHRRCGKLIIAQTQSERAALDEIEGRAAAAGIELNRLTSAAVRALEPELLCCEALESPETGIVDSHGLMLSLIAEAEDHGATMVFRTEVTGVEQKSAGWAVSAGDTRVLSSVLVNAAGLDAHRVAGVIDALPAAAVPEVYYAKGCYFAYSGQLPFSHLVYPVPVPGGLGTHLTLDLAGGARFGPDVHWVETPEYAVDIALKPQFVTAGRRIWAGLDSAKLHPGYAGVRPKLSPPGAPSADFVIQGEGAHGLPGLVNLFGIESPGLTASLALAETVASMLKHAGSV